MKPLTRRQAVSMLRASAIAATLPRLAHAVTHAAFTITVRTVPNSGVVLGSGVFAVSRPADAVFIPGGIADEALRHFIERQDPEPLLAKLAAADGVSSQGEFQPGRAFTVRATPGERLQFALKLGPSNRLFLAPCDGGIRLFDFGGRTLHGNVALCVTLFDADAPIVPVGSRPQEQTPTSAETMIEIDIAPSLEPELRRSGM